MQASPFCDFRQKTFSTIRKVTWILVILRFYKTFFMRLTWPSQRKRLWASKANILSIFAGARTFLFGTRSCQVMPRIRPGQRRWKALSLRSWGSTGSMFLCHRAACWARRLYRLSFWCWWSAWSCSRPFWPDGAIAVAALPILEFSSASDYSATNSEYQAVRQPYKGVWFSFRVRLPFHIY